VIRTFACKDTEELHHRGDNRKFKNIANTALRKLRQLHAAKELRDLNLPAISWRSSPVIARANTASESMISGDSASIGMGTPTMLKSRIIIERKKMAKRLKPVHPGEVLREDFLIPAAMSVNQLALALRISTPRLNQIVRGISAVTPNTALRLARYLNTTPDFWLNLQLQYDLDIAEDQEGSAIEREVLPRESVVRRSPERQAVSSKRSRSRT
jgi:addiction module HigA family antidote